MNISSYHMQNMMILIQLLKQNLYWGELLNKKSSKITKTEKIKEGWKSTKMAIAQSKTAELFHYWSSILEILRFHLNMNRKSSFLLLFMNRVSHFFWQRSKNCEFNSISLKFLKSCYPPVWHFTKNWILSPWIPIIMQNQIENHNQ